jgi:hypothetical protein
VVLKECLKIVVKLKVMVKLKFWYALSYPCRLVGERSEVVKLERFIYRAHKITLLCVRINPKNKKCFRILCCKIHPSLIIQLKHHESLFIIDFFMFYANLSYVAYVWIFVKRALCIIVVLCGIIFYVMCILSTW